MVIFLDRDGVINEIGDGYITDPNDFHLIPGSCDAIKLLKTFYSTICVVTNQSMIGRGLGSLEELNELHLNLDCILKEYYDIEIDHYFFCPHAPDEHCECRKPKLGMFEQAKKMYHVEPEKSWIIGDNKSDIAFGKAANIGTILVRTGYGADHEKECEPDYVVDDLHQAAVLIMRLKHGY